jgi:hypothetical protein
MPSPVSYETSSDAVDHVKALSEAAVSLSWRSAAHAIVAVTREEPGDHLFGVIRRA